MVKVDPKNGTLKDEAKAVAAAGRNGDKIIIHVMPEELPKLDAFMKKEFGSKGTTNPKTGIREYWSEKGVDSKSGGGVGGSGGASGNASGGNKGGSAGGGRDDGTRDNVGGNAGAPGGKPSPSRSSRENSATIGNDVVNAAVARLGGFSGSIPNDGISEVDRNQNDSRPMLNEDLEQRRGETDSATVGVPAAPVDVPASNNVSLLGSSRRTPLMRRLPNSIWA